MKNTAVREKRCDMIARYFDASPAKIFRASEIRNVFTEQREGWHLARTMSADGFISMLMERGKLRFFDFPFPYRGEQRYVWGDVPLLEILLALKRNAYFTHHTAMRMHRLTSKTPRTIYLNSEQRPITQDRELEQGRIDAAFSRNPRVSHNQIDHDGLRICFLNGMHTGQLGVAETQLTYDSLGPVRVRMTNLERTLIDIAVRPVYAGGVHDVLKAYRLARPRVSVTRLVGFLQELNYVYPYHQAIGFYLERAGYKPSSLDMLRRFPIQFDFYLAHRMGRTEYVRDWRLHIPRGF